MHRHYIRNCRRASTHSIHQRPPWPFPRQPVASLPVHTSSLGVPTTQYAGDARTDVYANFQTGARVTVNSSSNYTAYIRQLQKYPYFEYSWDQPDPVPEDLLLLFSEFLEKYGLEDVGYNVYYGAQGLSNVLDQLTVNVFKIFDGSFIDALHGGDVKGLHTNGEIYTRVGCTARGGRSVLVAGSGGQPAGQRHGGPAGGADTHRAQADHGVEATRQYPTALEEYAAIRIDLTGRERELFSRWKFSGYYTLLVNNTGLPSGYRFRNANAETMANIPPLPAPYQSVLYAMQEAAVKADVVEVIGQLRSTVEVKTTSVPQVVAFNSHTPFKLVVDAEAIGGGFYGEVAGLQGYWNTWYTGAAVISHSSAILWNFTEALLPEMIA